LCSSCLETVKKCAISALELMPDLVEAFERCSDRDP
jgi:hypothetical protein